MLRRFFALSLVFLTQPALAKLPTIAALTPHSVELLFEVGAGEQIVATVEYADYPEAARSIRRVGRHNQMDFEALMALQPDLVVLGVGDTSMHFVTRLRELGFNVVDTSVSQVAEIAPLLARLGELTGHKQQGAEAATRFSDEYARLKSAYQGRNPVPVFYQLWSEPLMTASSSWMDGLISDCGGVNLFADSLAEYPQVSVEQVVAAAPEGIIVPTNHGLGDNSTERWQSWPEIPAVANGQLYSVNSDWLHRTGPRILKGMAQLCEAIEQVRRSEKKDPAGAGSN
ncbi:cobalamin-binding protein [Ferrimonas sp. YFM]|uniref:cobalamin-binding protein n=1 Tax=Ferrimonas sp. YFM TaxID=3028878 RepID=UPI00257243EE|nr:cobalamin-binding protein [Ferrimonas sp. YFM]BDY05729.1 cobalamin-binding protein [Ferrimonas sp. YFM]